MKSELDDLITVLDDAVDMQDTRKYHDVLVNAYRDGILHDLRRYLNKQSKRVQELERTESEFLYSSKYLLEQNKRYREALEFINEELELVLHANKGLAERMFCIDNSKRKITEVLEGKE